MFGLTLGVLGALLLGTKEGRQLSREVINSLPDNLKKAASPFIPDPIPDTTPPLESPETTPHHAFFTPEPPPPTPPEVTPEPYLYHPITKSS